MRTQSKPNLPGSAPGWRGLGFITFVICIVLAVVLTRRQDEPALSGTVHDARTSAP